jgi:hypothetical protein
LSFYPSLGRGGSRGIICSSYSADSPNSPCRRSKNESPGLRSCGHHDGYPCARERPSLAIIRAWDVHEWGSTGEWWEGGDGVVWSDFHRVRHGCESVLESGEVDLL